MPLAVNLSALKALDVPTRYVLSAAFEDAAEHAASMRSRCVQTDQRSEWSAKVRVYRELAEGVRGSGG